VTQSRRGKPRTITGRAIWAVGCALAITFACGPAEKDDEEPGPGSSSAEQTFADTLVSAFCDGLASCCSSRTRVLDEAGCETKVRAIVAGRESPSDDVRFDADAAAQCLENMRATLATCAGIELEPCNRIYVGTLAAGQACDRNDECAPVQGSRTYCTGTCKAARRAAAGESCVRTCHDETDCVVLPGEPPSDLMNKSAWGECFAEDGLACVGGTCVRSPAEGAACLAGAFCDRGLDCESGTCVRLPTIGETCAGSCAPGAYCSAADVCAQELAAGAPCDDEEACSSSSCGRNACAAESCPSACQSPTLGAAHGSSQECSGTVHL
jgi:hypothetical protein